MANKIYSPPKELGKLEYDYSKKWNENQVAENIYIDKILTYCLKKGKGEYAGTELRIPHADGYACYAVFSLKPVTLIHMPIGDCWQSPLASYMPASEIKKYVDTDKNLAQIFAEHKKGGGNI